MQSIGCCGWQTTIETAPVLQRQALAYARGVRNSSDLNSRRIRSAALDAFIRGRQYRGVVQGTTDPLKSLPSSEELLSVEEEEEEEEEEE